MKRTSLPLMVTILLALLGASFTAAQATAATRIVFAHEGRLLGVSPHGGAVHTLARIPANTIDLAASADGRRFALLANRSLPYPKRGSIRSIYVLDLGRGLHRVARLHTRGTQDLALSPDGRRIAFVKDAEVWVADADGTHRRQVTAGREAAAEPAFTPSGEAIVFTRWPGMLYRTSLGGGEEVLLREDSRSPAVSRDGRIVYHESLEGRPERLRTISLDGGSPRTIATAYEPVFKTDPTWSPAGRAVAYRRLYERTGLGSTYRYSFYVLSGGRERRVIGGIRPFDGPGFRARGPVGPLWVPVP
jgi:dipeptidyl aminopeptidase/acylaminoacyl peptidase